MRAVMIIFAILCFVVIGITTPAIAQPSVSNLPVKVATPKVLQNVNLLDIIHEESGRMLECHISDISNIKFHVYKDFKGKGILEIKDSFEGFLYKIEFDSLSALEKKMPGVLESILKHYREIKEKKLDKWVTLKVPSLTVGTKP